MNDYFVVSTHREENVDSQQNFTDLLDSLNGIAEHYGKRVIVSTHPRTRKRLDSSDRKAVDRRIEFVKPFGFFDYIHLQSKAICTISDSGTITEESSILQFPAITIRQTHERPEGMDEATLIMSGLKRSSILDAIHIVTSQAGDRTRSRVVPDYDVENVSMKVVRIIVSYIDYVRRTVWKEQ